MTGKEKIGLAIAGASFLFVFCFAWLVWPTKYRYFETKVADVTVIVRINRLTGETCNLRPMSTVWKKQVPFDLQPIPKEVPVSTEKGPAAIEKARQLPGGRIVVSPLELDKTPQVFPPAATTEKPKYVEVPCDK